MQQEKVSRLGPWASAGAAPWPPSNPLLAGARESSPRGREPARPDVLGLARKLTPLSRSLARGGLILVSKLYKILILQSGNLGVCVGGGGRGGKPSNGKTLVMQH